MWNFECLIKIWTISECHLIFHLCLAFSFYFARRVPYEAICCDLDNHTMDFACE